MIGEEQRFSLVAPWGSSGAIACHCLPYNSRSSGGKSCDLSSQTSVLDDIKFSDESAPTKGDFCRRCFHQELSAFDETRVAVKIAVITTNLRFSMAQSLRLKPLLHQTQARGFRNEFRPTTGMAPALNPPSFEAAEDQWGKPGLPH
jgi:hypothetical protein